MLVVSGLLIFQNSSISSSNDNLRENIANINNAIIALQSENEALRDKISEIESESLDLKLKNEQLEVMNSELRNENEKLQNEYNALLEKQGAKQQNNEDSSVKTAYLTFDDGVSKYTDDILDILKEYNIKATFFPNWKDGYDNIYKRIVDEGHTIGNHTYNHEYKDVYSSVEGFINEVKKLQEKIKQVTGGYTPELFRFPGGSNNTVHRKYNPDIIPEAIKAIHEMGMEYYDWNVDSADASSVTPLPAAEIVSNVVSGSVKSRVIVLMHDTAAKPTTVEALPKIIEELMKKGYTFDKLTKDVVPVQFKKP